MIHTELPWRHHVCPRDGTEQWGEQSPTVTLRNWRFQDWNPVPSSWSKPRATQYSVLWPLSGSHTGPAVTSGPFSTLP